MTMVDSPFLEVAIENARQSLALGGFPAGAVVALNGVILASEVSSLPPALFHPDSKAVSTAYAKHGVLTGATLYVVMEPCLMCTGVAYWAGVRRIVYALPKSSLSGEYYETPAPTRNLPLSFNEPVELVHLGAWGEKALEIVTAWERKNSL